MNRFAIGTLASAALVIDGRCGGSSGPQTVTLFSEPNYGGESAPATITGLYGCTNVLPDFRVRSINRTDHTMVVLHYGADCAGHVVADATTNYADLATGCAKSLFVKFHGRDAC